MTMTFQNLYKVCPLNKFAVIKKKQSKDDVSMLEKQSEENTYLGMLLRQQACNESFELRPATGPQEGLKIWEAAEINQITFQRKYFASFQIWRGILCTPPGPQVPKVLPKNRSFFSRNPISTFSSIRRPRNLRIMPKVRSL